MLDIKRILFATDFSEGAERAFPWAVSLATLHGSALHMLHTIALYDADPALPVEHYRVLERLYERMVEHAEERMRSAARESAPPELVIQMSQLRGIAPAEAILDYMLQSDIDLAVLGSHGHRGVRKLLLGSVSAEVARLAHCPVLIVGRERAPHIRRILVPLDLSEVSDVGLEHALELAAGLGASVLLLHVVEVQGYLDFYFPQPAEEYFDLARLRRDAIERLLQRARDVAGHDVPVDADALVAHPVEGIRDVAEKRGADLILMASHGHSGHQPALIGSVANGVLRHAPCPVMIVKAFGKSLLP